MNRSILLITAVASGLAIPSSVRGQDSPSASLADSIETFTQQLAESWVRLDADGYLKWFSDDFVFYIDGQRVPRDEFEAVVRAATGSLQESTFEISDSHVEVLGPDAGVISFDLREVMVDTTGATTDLNAAMTLIWQRQRDEWRITIAHESLRRPVGP
jgi:uncharacterized protein (TIGR02246 family)